MQKTPGSGIDDDADCFGGLCYVSPSRMDYYCFTLYAVVVFGLFVVSVKG